MKPLCVIPARAGSKRLRNKNFLPLSGRPMVAWTIEAALESKIFDKVYVSTESEAIAQIARDYGADVPGLRPEALAGDTVTNVEVSLHLLDMLAEAGLDHEAIVCLQPSSPLRTSTHIRQSWERFTDQQRDFLVSVTSIDPHYFHWALSREDETWSMFFGDRFMKVRQELPEVYRPNGAIKIALADVLREERNFFGANLGVYEMPEDASVHVATDIDFHLCKTLLNNDS